MLVAPNIRFHLSSSPIYLERKRKQMLLESCRRATRQRDWEPASTAFCAITNDYCLPAFVVDSESGSCEWVCVQRWVSNCRCFNVRWELEQARRGSRQAQWLQSVEEQVNFQVALICWITMLLYLRVFPLCGLQRGVWVAERITERRNVSILSDSTIQKFKVIIKTLEKIKILKKSFKLHWRNLNVISVCYIGSDFVLGIIDQ